MGAQSVKKIEDIVINEKVIIFAIFGIIDILQVILSLFIVTAVAVPVVDVFAGLLLYAYGSMRKLWTPQKLMILGATFVGELIPVVNAMPFWTLDVMNLYSKVGMVEDGPDEKTGGVNTNASLNKDGVRLPTKNIATEESVPANVDGIKSPKRV